MPIMNTKQINFLRQNRRISHHSNEQKDEKFSESAFMRSLCVVSVSLTLIDLTTVATKYLSQISQMKINNQNNDASWYYYNRLFDLSSFKKF